MTIGRASAARVECEICGREFSVQSSRKDSVRYCGMVCRAASDKRYEGRTCPVCGKVFHAPASAPNKTCSRAHGQLHRAKKTVVGTTYEEHGYVTVHMPDHPKAHAGRVYEHILVAEQKLNRTLSSNEQVHHIDHDKANNDPKNLIVLTAAEHSRLHFYERRANPPSEAWVKNYLKQPGVKPTP